MASVHQSADLVNNKREWDEVGKRGLTLNTKAINIIWGGEGSKDRYWRRTTEHDDEGSFAAVELLGVYWLEITGKVPLDLLSPGTTYNLFVTIKLTPAAAGWDHNPVIFKVHLPGNVTASAAVKLSNYLDRGWVDVPDGGLQFSVPEDTSSRVLSFAMYEIEGEERKKGLIIREVHFMPQVNLRTINYVEG